ncbi:hypothetical protein GCM10010172_71270 [Paractinoplanes ferrugineus]|uniref:Uncharacterized protein n=1 Tax=Paractinoplanes ferrugineus TaxID=113564 RepID=A0A919J814_9ACTN|nr:hypothetical protein [Actinoplanes ferrugineus]GIE15012.1 hypothetical protein Afe05nite_68520 [Actinoplanes ferrugineus]
MSQPRATIAPEFISFDLVIAALRADAATAETVAPLDLFLPRGPRAEHGEGEDGGGSHSPPAEDGPADGGPAETGTGEDGGGSHTPPSKDGGAKDRGTGEDGGGSHSPPADRAAAVRRSGGSPT